MAFVDGEQFGHVIHTILKNQGGVVLVIGAKASNYPQVLREQARIVWWDSQDIGSTPHDPPSNTRLVLMLRFTQHRISNTVLDWCRRYRVPCRWCSTGEVRKLLFEVFVDDHDGPPDTLSNPPPPELPDVPVVLNEDAPLMVQPEPDTESEVTPVQEFTERFPERRQPLIQPPVPTTVAPASVSTPVGTSRKQTPMTRKNLVGNEDFKRPNAMRHWLVQQSWDPANVKDEKHRLMRDAKHAGFTFTKAGFEAAMYQMAIRFRWIPYNKAASTRVPVPQEPHPRPLPGTDYWRQYSPYAPMGPNDYSTSKPRTKMHHNDTHTKAIHTAKVVKSASVPDTELGQVTHALNDAQAAIALALEALAQYEATRKTKIQALMDAL